MKLVFAAGSHPRHAFIARKLHDLGLLDGLVIEQREVHVPKPPTDLPLETANLFNHHFKQRQKIELDFFEHADFPRVPKIVVSRAEINSEQVRQFLQKIAPTLFISYGIHILNNATLACVTGEKWNIHGGLSPWYRGCITHFWPSYLLEPQMTGMTIHELTDQLDAGDIVQQNCAPLVAGDGLHHLSCRAVSSMVDEFEMLFKIFDKQRYVIKKKHKSSGRIWRSSDWHPHHLHLIYDYYNDAVVDHYLSGHLNKKTPKLFRQF
ncbi:methionyl-tRNA formyltransferase [Ectothiorhodospiraceae bacterium BW-2]|nr:methionyl-tRNA formyltransferase [Ectothiorhodospiraceae bacterium BW-2]